MTFLSAFAQRHFDECPRQSLLAGIASRIDERNVTAALASGCRPLQHLAWRKITAWEPETIAAIVVGAMESDGPELPAILKCISHDSVSVEDSLLERIASLMTSSRADVRVNAARVIALRYPRSALPLLNGNSPLDREVLRTLCLADDPDLTIPLMRAFGFPSKLPPPTIGFLITPEWLSDNYAREPLHIEWLIRNCGYCDDGMLDGEVSREALNLLSSGFSFITSRMTSEPRMTKIAHRWQRRIRAFVWRLLPDELDLERDDAKSLDIENAMEIDLFLAAVRDSDRMLFIEQKSRPPFDRRSSNRDPSPACLHTTTRFHRRKFVDEPLRQAEAWNIPREHRGDFLIDTARVLLEPHEETRSAAELIRRGKWMPQTDHFIHKPLGQSSGSELRIDQQSDSKRYSHRTKVIDLNKPPEPDDRLSPGADSVKNLAMACGLDWRSIADWMAEKEASWSRCVIPMGIEAQIPKVEPSRFAEWKEALPFLGIPSPVRPEFGGMVEASFRPSKSFHAEIAGIQLLNQLGIISEPQDIAMHVSLQGDIDHRVRFLVFPQLFIHPSKRHRNRPDSAMTRVMSKGLVHVHDDAELFAAFDDDHLTNATKLRTELRACRIFAEESSCKGLRFNLFPSYLSDLISLQVLGSTLRSSCTTCQDKFDAYATAVTSLVSELPQEFQSLLDANYFESTGDPSDVALLNLLPIFRAWKSVRDLVQREDLSSSLDLRFRTVRHQHVRQILEHWSSEHGLLSGDVRVNDDEIELELPASISSPTNAHPKQ